MIPQRASSGRTAWALHRASGLLLAMYVVVHLMLMRSLLGSEDAFARWMRVLGGSAGKAALSLALGLLSWHAVSGFRVMWLDTAPESSRHAAAFRACAVMACGVWLLAVAMLWGFVGR